MDRKHRQLFHLRTPRSPVRPRESRGCPERPASCSGLRTASQAWKGGDFREKTTRETCERMEEKKNTERRHFCWSRGLPGFDRKSLSPPHYKFPLPVAHVRSIQTIIYGKFPFPRQESIRMRSRQIKMSSRAEKSEFSLGQHYAWIPAGPWTSAR